MRVHQWNAIQIFQQGTTFSPMRPGQSTSMLAWSLAFINICWGYMHCLQTYISNIFCWLYTYFWIGKIETLEANSNNEIPHISAWFKVNKLSFYIIKIHYILFIYIYLAYAKMSSNVKPSTDGEPIYEVDKIEFLGISIDEKSMWNDILFLYLEKSHVELGWLSRYVSLKWLTTPQNEAFRMIAHARWRARCDPNWIQLN